MKTGLTFLVSRWRFTRRGGDGDWDWLGSWTRNDSNCATPFKEKTCDAIVAGQCLGAPRYVHFTRHDSQGKVHSTLRRVAISRKKRKITRMDLAIHNLSRKNCLARVPSNCPLCLFVRYSVYHPGWPPIRFTSQSSFLLGSYHILAQNDQCKRLNAKLGSWPGYLPYKSYST